MMQYMSYAIAKTYSFFARKNDTGATLIEYALLVAFIAIVALTGIIFLGNQISGLFNSIGTWLQGVGGDVGGAPTPTP